MSNRYDRGWGGHRGRGRGSRGGRGQGGRGRGGWQQGTHPSDHHNRERNIERWNQRGHSPGQLQRGHSSGRHQRGNPLGQHQRGNSVSQHQQGGFAQEWNQRHNQEDDFHGHHTRPTQRSRSHDMQFGSNAADMNHGNVNETHREMTLDQDSQNRPGRLDNSRSFQQEPLVRPPFPDQKVPIQHQSQMQQVNPNLHPPVPRLPGADMHQTGPAPQIFTEQIPVHQRLQDEHNNMQSRESNVPHNLHINSQQPYHAGPNMTPQTIIPSNKIPVNHEQVFHQPNPAMSPDFHHHPGPQIAGTSMPPGNLPSTNLPPPHNQVPHEFHNQPGSYRPPGTNVPPDFHHHHQGPQMSGTSMPPGNLSSTNAPPPHNSAFAHSPQPSRFDGGTDVLKTKQMMDKEWVDHFLAGIRQKSIKRGMDSNGILVPISKGKHVLREYLTLLKQLEMCRATLASCMDADEAIWKRECSQANQIKVKLSGMKHNLEASSFTPRLIQRIAKTKKRRESIAKRKKRAFLIQEAEKERIRQITKKIDADLAKKQKGIEDAKNEAALQKEADSILFEVRSKKKDADKTLEILRALRKLRNVRKEAAAKKGSYTSPDSDKHFESSIQKLEPVMNKARTTYRDEEQTLLVMLEEEHEENKEKQMEILRQRQKESALRSVQKRKEALFGKDEPVGPEDLMFPFQQFYLIAEHNLHALVDIRRQWDQFLVPPDDPQGSGIPVDWVLPSEPSSKEWASAMEDT